MEQMYNVSSNPHVRDKMTTSRIMQLVVIALLPTTLFGIWNFGFRAFLVVLVTVASSVFFEWLYDFEYVKLGLPKPDLVIYLDVDVETSLRRMKHRQEKTHTSADIHEKDIEYLKNCMRVLSLIHI